jgi:hypothetical protein
MSGQKAAATAAFLFVSAAAMTAFGTAASAILFEYRINATNSPIRKVSL